MPDLVKLTMRLKFSLQRQWLIGKKEERRHLITKQLNLEASATSDLVARYQTATSDLISKVRIWEKIEKKQEEIRRKGEAEEEKRNITDLRRNFQDVISDQTTKLRAEMTRGRKSEEDEFGELFSYMKSIMKKQEVQMSTKSVEQKEDQFGELFRNIKSLTGNVEYLMAQMKEQKTELENMKKLMMKGRSDM